MQNRSVRDSVVDVTELAAGSREFAAAQRREGERGTGTGWAPLVAATY